MIREAEGNLLAADVDALVNTVNTVGVMGKGIALQFKRAYPDMYRAYEHAAKAGELTLGHMHVWETGAFDGPRFIINFPTKRHWRGPSRLDYIAAGLDDLLLVVRERGIRSIALPPLGCGNGGLDWAEVKSLIEERLGHLPIDVILYPPAGSPRAETMIERREQARLTTGRVALLEIMREYRQMTFEAPSVVEIQKLMYFLQVAGEPLRLAFVKGRYGPYADNLRHVLKELEGHFIIGYGDGSAHVNEAEPLRLAHVDEREAAIGRLDDVTRARIERVLHLAGGYASAYGLELLASTHWTATREARSEDSADEVIALVRAWTQRKERLFGEDHIRRAWEALRLEGWLEPALVGTSA